MRKDRLENLLAQYNKLAKNNPDLVVPEIDALNQFLASEEIASYRAVDDIAFNKFADFLEKNNQIEILTKILSQQYLVESKKKSAAVFRKFKYAGTSHLERLQADSKTEIAKSLDVSDLGNLSQVSSSFFSELKDVNYWRSHFIKAGLNPDLLRALINTGIIQDYRNLYKTFTRLTEKRKNNVRLWDLLFLSAELKALEHAITLSGFSPEMQNFTGALFSAALSGNIDAIEFVIKKLKIDPKSVDAIGANVFHYAALSGSIEAMKFAIDKLQIDPKSIDKRGRNVLHYSALGGSVEAMKFVVNELKIKPGSIDAEHMNALHWAVVSENIKAVKHALYSLKISPNSQDRTGRNILHWAALMGSVKLMKFVVDDVKINPKSIDAKQHKNALHYAARSGNIAAMEFAIKKLKIDPKSTDKHQLNALHHAAYWGKVEAMRYAVNQLKIDPNSVSQGKRNALHYATQNGNINAIKCAVDDLKIDPNSKDESGRNAFLFAVWFDQVEAMKFAIEELKIDKNSVDVNGWNALHLAVIRNSTHTIEYLRQLGLTPAPQTIEEAKTRKNSEQLLTALTGPLPEPKQNLTTMESSGSKPTV